jgi:hypothetical protein
MGHAAYGGADIGEVLTTAQHIVAGDYDSWHDEWLAIADKIAPEAKTQLAAGHRTSVRDWLMRASIYYHNARRCQGLSISAVVAVAASARAGLPAPAVAACVRRFPARRRRRCRGRSRGQDRANVK